MKKNSSAKLKFLSLVMVVAILVGILPPVDASSVQTSDTHRVVYDPQVQVDTEVPMEEFLTSVEEAGECLRAHYVARDESFKVYVKLRGSQFDSIFGLAEELNEIAAAHTGVGYEGDYLNNHFMDRGKVTWSYQYDYVSYYYFTFEYTASYSTTWEQEQRVNEILEEVYQQLDMENDSDYMKTLKIYNWITSNVTYNYDALNENPNNPEQAAYAWTAYGALEYGTCVCEGYALLLYRMLLDAGIDNRYIVGRVTNSGIPHAWNIVKIGELYYNADATWDAYTVAKSPTLDYFLLGDSFFEDHKSYDEYEEPEFQEAHPLSDSDYVPTGSEPMGTCGENLYWNLEEDGTLRIWGSGDMYEYQASTTYGPAWYDYNNRITAIVVEDGVMSIGECAFFECGAETAIISDSVTNIGRYAFMAAAGLKEVRFGKGVQEIGEYAFAINHESLEVYFSGEAPVLDNTSLDGCACVYYPAWLASWEDVVSSNYGNLAWEAYCLEHQYETVTQDATCTEDGSIVHCCKFCGQGWSEVIPASGHTDADENNLCDTCGVWCGDTLLGDVNGDLEIDTTDAYLIVQYYNELLELSESQLASADVDGNAEVDTTDAYFIVQYYNELIDSFPISN